MAVTCGYTDIMFTDFGAVKLSPKTVAWIGAYDKDWREIRNKRSKRAKRVRERIAKLEIAVSVAAEIMWLAGGELKEY